LPFPRRHHSLTNERAVKIKTQPVKEPVTLVEAKDNAIIEHANDDTLITRLIKTARGLAEKHTGRVFITQVWQQFMNNFPVNSQHGILGDWWDGVRQGPITALQTTSNFIEILKPPLITVDKFNVYGVDDVATLVANTTYFVDDVREPGRLVLNFAEIWPTLVLRPANAVEIEFTAGYGIDETKVPEDIKQAILIAVTHFYEHRGDGHKPMVLPDDSLIFLEPLVLQNFDIL